MPDAVICRRLVIHGEVQGVGFRWSMVCEAERIGGLVGWVRNRRDGTVEAVAGGKAEQVEMLVAWAHRGPASARVTRVDTFPETADDLLFDGFEQRPTA